MPRRDRYKTIIAISLFLAAFLLLLLAHAASADARQHSKFQKAEKAIVASPASSQRNCAERAGIVARLAGDKYNETQIGIGMHAQAGAVVELWMSEDGGWSILLSLPNGQTCIMAAGKGWQALSISDEGLPG